MRFLAQSLDDQYFTQFCKDLPKIGILRQMVPYTYHLPSKPYNYTYICTYVLILSHYAIIYNSSLLILTCMSFMTSQYVGMERGAIAVVHTRT